LKEVIRLAFFVIAYWLTVRLGLLLVTQPEGIASIWPTSGFALAVVILTPKRRWATLLAVIFITNAVGNWSGGNLPLVSLGFALANTLEAALGAAVLTYFCKSKITFERSREVIALLLAATLVNGLTALLGAAVSTAAFHGSLMNAWLIWWTADGLGIILVTPFIISLTARKMVFQSVTWRQVMESALFVLILTLFAWLLFGPFTIAEKPLLASYMFFPLLLWLTFRFIPRAMPLALLLVAVIAIWNTVQGYGIFSIPSQTRTEHLVSLQIFLAVMTCSGLLMSTIVTKRKRTEEALRESETRFRTFFEHAAVGVALVETKSGYFKNINQKYCDFLGYSKEEALNLTYQMVTYPDDVEENTNLNALLLCGKIREFSIEKRYIRKDGSVVWGNLTGSALWEPGKAPPVNLHIAVVQDITERKADEKKIQLLNAELEQLALTDFLTKLNNRRHFMQRGVEEFKRAHRNGQPLALLMLDIDHFKMVNDSYGHETGDLALQQVAAVLKSSVREIDILGRLGGEEFAVLLPNTPLEDAALLAERIRLSIASKAFQTPGNELTSTLTISVGVAALTEEISGIDDLLRNADAAMYYAKDSGRNCVSVY
jgi:diguanylate cyclase (GGDEF)-like protein/PAS domain S-box-containing protein